MADSDLGLVARLWRYPVKSMLGEAPASLQLEARGVVADRLFAVRDEAGKFGSGKTTRRFRRIEGLFRFRAHLDGEIPVVTFPDGTVRRGDDPAIHAALSDALGEPVTLAREAAISHLDAGPVHLVTTSTLRVLGGADPRRFRPNLLVDTDGAGSAEARLLEDEWLGQELAVGSEVRLRVAARTERCVMVGFAQDELPEEPAILHETVRLNEARIGVYAEVVTPGAIRLGDRVRRL